MSCCCYCLKIFRKKKNLKIFLTHKTFSFCFSLSFSFVPEKAKTKGKRRKNKKRTERGYRGGVITIKIYESCAKIQITLHLLQFLLLRNDTTVQLFSSIQMCAVRKRSSSSKCSSVNSMDLSLFYIIIIEEEYEVK